MSTTITDSPRVSGLRLAVETAKTEVEAAWEHHRDIGYTDATRDAYRDAADRVRQVRRELAEAIAVDQGKRDFAVTITVTDLDAASTAEAEVEALKRLVYFGASSGGVTVTTDLPALRPVVVTPGPDDPPGVAYTICAVCGADPEGWQYEEDEWSVRKDVTAYIDGETVTVTVGSCSESGDDPGNDEPGLVCGTCQYRIDADVTDWT